jgi:hypothetical protein
MSRVKKDSPHMTNSRCCSGRLPSDSRDCDRRHCGRPVGRSNIVVRSNLFAVLRKRTLMRVTRTRAFALLAIALLWAVTPAMACVLPGATMTPAERECCHHMAEQCGSTMMPASHSCCKAQGPTNTVLPQAQAAGPVRPFTIAVIPPVASLGASPVVTVRCHLSFLHAPPPEPSPGCNSVLRI